MNNPTFQFSVPFIDFTTDRTSNLTIVKINNKKNVYPFFAPKDFSLMVNKVLLGGIWDFDESSLEEENAQLCFINHHPQAMKYEKGEIHIPEGVLPYFPKGPIEKFNRECIQKCSYMIVEFENGIVNSISYTVPYYRTNSDAINGFINACMYVTDRITSINISLIN